MPMSTPSGQKTYKYDMVVPDQVKEQLDHQTDVISGFQQYQEETDRRLKSLENANSDLMNTVAAMQVQWSQERKRVNSLTAVMYTSRLFRFLNAVCGWYICSGDRIYVNCIENEKYGRPPFSTRVSRWLRCTFLERPHMWIHTIFTKEPVNEETTQQEECTNDEEGIQPPEE